MRTYAVPRPGGTFFGANPQGDIDTPTSGSRTNTSLHLGDDGTAELVYRTSGVGGVERITATVSADGKSRSDTAVVRIRFAGLVAIPASGLHWTFQASRNHNGGDAYLAPGVLTAVEAIWNSYRDSAVTNPNDYPMTGSTFTVTAVGLVWGGLYDYQGDWSNPHKQHRTGHDVDFDNAAAEGDAQQMAEVCNRFQFERQAIKCELHNGNHFHAFVGQ